MLPLVLAGILSLAAAEPQRADWLDAHRETAARLIGEALATTRAWERLAYLTDTFGHRLAGSAALQATIAWAVEEMRRDGLENVRAERVMVPHWERGRESAEIVAPVRHPLVVLGLGNSVGTPADGVRAPVVVVRSFDDLEARKAQIPGTIVLFNVPYTGYGETVRYRSSGASRAAALGAVGMLLRSVGNPGLRTPHTGALNYAEDLPQIPAAAVALEDADRLQRMQDRGERPVVRLMMEARMLPDAESANVVGEIRGRARPEEVVVLGCHLDSWDVGTGATDDAGGCVAVWEVLRIVKQLGLRPRRTLRTVLFTNEENGLRGGFAYRDQHAGELASHVLMIESDSGVFRPLGVGFTGNDAARAMVEDISTLLAGIGATAVGPSGGGADIGPSVQAAGVPAMSLAVDGSTYFTIHHTPADTVDKIDPREMAKCVATLAVMSWVVADAPQRLGR
ncbi:MAG: M20/M25/M40 family metallo-hydrolase [Acidobacteriota bacterium]